MKKPLVSVVIPTHNRQDMIVRLIVSLLKSTYKNLEIIIINDASTDDTEKVLKEKFGSKKNISILTNKKNLFAAGSRNVGLKKSTGEFIFFIDDDNVVDLNLITELVSVFVSHPEIGELGPVNYSFQDKKKIVWARTVRNMSTSLTYQDRSLLPFKNKKVWNSDDIPNAFMVRSSVILKNKILLREKFGIMYEEGDFAYRIRNSGYTVCVVKSAKIYHDTEEYINGKLAKDYLYHFMEDIRRPYVIARNRLIFHSLYSTKKELFQIIFFWNWVITGYYFYKILFYSGVGEFSIFRRLTLSKRYIKGIIDGLQFVFSREKKL